jgi:hypothetical protein
MPIIQSVIGSSYQFVPPITTLTLSGAEPGVGYPNGGLWKRRYDQGYFGEDPTWFDGKTPDSAGTDTTLNITTNADNYSVMWTGYFAVPSTGTYRFATNSDDGSYVWMGSDAISGYTVNNCIVNNGGAHGQQMAYSNYYSMSQGDFYPIRIIYGEIGGGDVFDFFYEFNNDGNFQIGNWSTLMLSNDTTAEGFNY